MGFIISMSNYAHLAKYVEMVKTSQYTPLALQLAKAEAEDFVRSHAEELFGGDQEKLEEALRRCGDDNSFRRKAVRTFYENLTLGRGIYAWIDLSLQAKPYSDSRDERLSVNFIEGPSKRKMNIDLAEDEKRAIYPLQAEYIFVSGIVLPIMADSKNHAADRLLHIARDEGIDPQRAVLDKELRERALEIGSFYRRQDVERTTRWVNEGIQALDTDLLPTINQLSLGYLEAHIQEIVPGHATIGEPTPPARNEPYSRLVEASARESIERASRRQ